MRFNLETVLLELLRSDDPDTIRLQVRILEGQARRLRAQLESYKQRKMVKRPAERPLGPAGRARLIRLNRDRQIAQLAARFSNAELAQRFRLSPQRISKIVQREFRRMAREAADPPVPYTPPRPLAELLHEAAMARKGAASARERERGTDRPADAPPAR